MKLVSTIKRAARSLSQAKVRTFLTALAIAVGAFTISLSLATGAGVKNYTGSLFEGSADKTKLDVSKGYQFEEAPTNEPTVYDPNSMSESGVKIELLTTGDLEKIRKVSGVKSAERAYNLSPNFITRAGQQKFIVSVSTAENHLDPGTEKPVNPKNGEIVLPKSFVKALGFESETAAVQQEVELQFTGQTGVKSFTFRIAGVAPESENANAMTGSSGPTALISVADATEITKFQTPEASDRFSYATVIVEDEGKVEAVKNEIKNLGYEAVSIEDIQKILFQVVNVLQGIVAGFGILALIASVFGIINTQYISVLERTSQIGLMKALGMRRRDIANLFRIEAALIGLIGGLIGIILAWLTSLVLNPLAVNGLNLESGTSLFIFQLPTVLLLLIILMLVAVVAGMLPARKAAKLDPIEALRTE